MDRRTALAGVGSLALAFLGGTASAQTATPSHDHQHMHGNPQQALIDATADCISKGQACLAHCIVLLSSGDKAMAACAKTVNQMLALCGALQNLANQQSSLVTPLAKVTLEACQACESECRKHEKVHAECKACAESCAACITACKAALC